MYVEVALDKISRVCRRAFILLARVFAICMRNIYYIVILNITVVPPMLSFELSAIDLVLAIAVIILLILYLRARKEAT